MCVSFFEDSVIFAANCQAFLGSWSMMLFSRDSCNCWVWIKAAVVGWTSRKYRAIWSAKVLYSRQGCRCGRRLQWRHGTDIGPDGLRRIARPGRPIPLPYRLSFFDILFGTVQGGFFGDLHFQELPYFVQVRASARRSRWGRGSAIAVLQFHISAGTLADP